MGLSVYVGIVAEYRQEDVDEETLEEARQEFEAVNAALRAAGLPEHHEPEQAQGGAPWDWHIGSYSCLHCLRRVAAYLAAGRPLPEPSLDEPTHDPLLRQYYETIQSDPRTSPTTASQLSLPGSVPPQAYRVVRGRPFSHLMDHADYGGYYLPIQFPEVLDPAPELGAPGGWIGSAYGLKEECRELAKQLQMPTDADLGELDQLRAEYPEIITRPGWKRYVGECFVCLALLTAAEISITSGCAIVFC
jgi:hypothetical protein